MKSSNVGGGAQGAAAKNGAADKNAAADDMNVKEFYSLEFGRMRTIQDENGEPLFCGKDVCKALGYARPDKAVNQHVNNLDVLKRSIKVPGSLRKDGTRTMRSQKMLFVNESGVYSLVFGSKLESAQRFKHWVTSEVLPAIRKNGGYFHINPDETPEQIKARFQKVLEKAIAERNEVIVSLEKDVDRMLPKELYVDNVLDSISCYTTTQIAKELGITAQELNRSLCACHVQYYQSGQYMLYAEYAHMGLAKSRTEYNAVLNPKVQVIAEKTGHVYTHTYLVWTERGRKFIHDLAKSEVEGVKSTRRGPKNMLQQLPDTFTFHEVELLRMENGLDKEGTKRMLNTWVFRQYIRRTEKENGGDGNYNYNNYSFEKLKFRRDGVEINDK